jgi:hypothetical protein
LPHGTPAGEDLEPEIRKGTDMTERDTYKDYSDLLRQVRKLADKARRSHASAMRAQYRYMNCQGGTQTSRIAQESFNRHSEAFDATIAELKALI